MMNGELCLEDMENEEILRGALYNIGLMSTLVCNSSNVEELQNVLTDIQHTVMLVNAIIEDKDVVH